MSSLALLLTCLSAQAAPAQAPAPAAAPTALTANSPEARLFAHAMVVGAAISDGVGLDKELGAPGSMSDVVQASLLFETKREVERHVFDEIGVAHQQIQAAVEGQASIVIALDYLIPYAYAMQSDDARMQQVATALKALEPIKCPIVLGDVPDLRAALAVEKPALAAAQVPSVETLKALNDSVVAWAAAHKEVVIAPVAMVFAQVEKKEPFTIHAYTWPASWLSDLMQTDRVHTRLHGSIALWLGGLDALCHARLDLDPRWFDWNALSIYRKVYAAKSRAREKALEEEITRLRLPPSRPPPQPPIPAPPPDPSAKNSERKKPNQEDADKSGG
jgi:hypothetical protein